MSSGRSRPGRAPQQRAASERNHGAVYGSQHGVRDGSDAWRDDNYGTVPSRPSRHHAREPWDESAVPSRSTRGEASRRRPHERYPEQRASHDVQGRGEDRRRGHGRHSQAESDPYDPYTNDARASRHGRSPRVDEPAPLARARRGVRDEGLYADDRRGLGGLQDLPVDAERHPVGGTRAARHQRRRQRMRERRRNVTAAVAVVLVFLLLAVGGWWGFGKVRDFFSAPDYSGNGTGSVMVTIDDGETAAAIGNTLVRHQVVKSAEAFVRAAKDDSRSRNLQPGTYRLHKEMNAAAALRMLLDKKSRVGGVTLPEGASVKQMLQKISDQTHTPLAELQNAAQDTGSLGLPDWSSGHLEGFLFPGTYQFRPHSDAKTILSTMVARTVQELTTLDFVNKANAKGMEPYQVLTVASLVEGEGITSDFGKIAQVVYNRLAQDMRLDFDSTTQYWLELNGHDRKDHLTDDDIRNSANNYSTTLNKGLPPTAIANPGKNALDAAINPESGPWLYFVVTESDGHSAFTDSLDEQNRNVEICREKNLGC